MGWDAGDDTGYRGWDYMGRDAGDDIRYRGWDGMRYRGWDGIQGIGTEGTGRDGIWDGTGWDMGRDGMG